VRRYRQQIFKQPLSHLSSLLRLFSTGVIEYQKVMLSNEDLMREFVAHSIHKKEILLANPALTAETVYDCNQVIAKSQGVIASTQLTNTICEFVINSKSSYWELMNKVLAEYSFMLIGEMDSRNCYRYHYWQVPNNYQMHCTKSVFLWRAWWKCRKHPLRPGIPLELLIKRRNSWYPVRDLIISDGYMYIKTLGSEIVVHPDDLVVWLNKIQKKSST
jgi:hypothetical protein